MSTAAVHPIFGSTIPLNWQVLTVDEIKAPEPSSCVAGPFGSNISSKYFVDDGVPVIRGGNLTDDLTRFVPTGFVFVSRDQAQAYRAQHVRAGDLVFTCWGTIGQVGRIPDDTPYPEYIISNKQLKLRVDPSRGDSLFLFYYFSGPGFVEYIRGRAVGSAVPGINLGILKSFPVVLPPLPIQRKIVAILAAYDDLIENNNRRIHVLEEMAQRIYREWFVNFRYPGHEGVPLVDSAMGPIPRGWNVTTASEAIDIDPKTSVPADGAVAFVPMTALSETASYLSEVERRVCPGGSHFRNGDTLFARITPCLENGKTAFVQALDEGEVAVGSTEFIVLRSRRLTPECVYLLARSAPFRQHAVKSMSGATGRQRVRREAFDSYLLAIPPARVLQRIQATAKPAFREAHLLHEANGRLRRARELLLPRLIAGQVEIDKLDIAVPEEATA